MGAFAGQHIDLLINPISDRQGFESILARWLSLNEDRREARARAAETFR
jgi:hypothetical protein